MYAIVPWVCVYTHNEYTVVLDGILFWLLSQRLRRVAHSVENVFLSLWASGVQSSKVDIWGQGLKFHLSGSSTLLGSLPWPRMVKDLAEDGAPVYLPSSQGKGGEEKLGPAPSLEGRVFHLGTIHILDGQFCVLLGGSLEHCRILAGSLAFTH